MSALAEALVAAQRRALTALEKQYTAGRYTTEEVKGIMDGIGLSDPVDQDRLLLALDVIRDTGAALPSEPKPTNGEPKASELHTDAQATLIDKMWNERGGKPGDKPILTGLTKADASKLIDQLKTNTYNVADWEIPF